jgi:transposase
VPKPIEQDEAASLNGASQETVPKKTRRRFSASEKLRIVKAADAALASGERGALESLLRQERIYSSHLSAWRQQLASGGSSGLAGRKPGRKPKLDAKERELAAVTKELAAVKYKLRVANALIALQKKAHEVLGIALPECDEASS